MTSEKPVRLGMIGCGAIAEVYHLPAMEKLPDVAGNTVLVEPNAVRLAAMSEKFSVAGGVADYRELEGKVDGVIVATPPSSHFAICQWFLERGIHVLCEKPLTESSDEARVLTKIARANSVGLAVNQTRRFYPSYAKIRELVATGELGTLKSIKYHEGFDFDWPAASQHHFSVGCKGVWSDTGVHLLDSVCYWLNAKPELVASWNDSDGGPEALATVHLRYEACEIEIKVSRLGKLMNGFRIEGTEGVIQASIDETSKVVVELPNGKSKTYRCGPSGGAYTDNANTMLANFVKVIRGEETEHVSGTSVVGTIELLEQAYEIAQPYRMPWNEPIKKLCRPLNEDSEESSSEVQARSVSAVERRPLRVLVTGTSGFLGGRVVETMWMADRGLTPVAALRKWNRAARVARHPVELAICDIENPTQVAAAVQGVDAIVHCAKGDSRESIVDGTRHLLQAAKQHGVERFVFLSTAEVYGAGVSGSLDEQAPTPVTGRMYGDSKIEAEQVCREYRELGVPVTILRPSIIYGPFSSWWSVMMGKRLQSGKWGTFESHGDGIANLVYVDDLVRAIELALTHPDAPGQTYNINGPDRVTWNGYFSAFNDAMGLPPLRPLTASSSRLRTIVMDKIDFVAGKVLDRYEDKIMEIYLRGGLISKTMKWIKGELTSTPSGNELNDLFARDAVYTDTKIRQQLGFVSMFDLPTGLKHTVDWMRLHEFIEPRRSGDCASMDASRVAADAEEMEAVGT